MRAEPDGSSEGSFEVFFERFLAITPIFERFAAQLSVFLLPMGFSAYEDAPERFSAKYSIPERFAARLNDFPQLGCSHGLPEALLNDFLQVVSVLNVSPHG
ncbi:hypothetical protein [Bradyrhizobium sp. WYCCWR 12699]|uniref:hypothetical protein n=1 Tax=Bradyrhizobium sp. WYCCWR 12699 TaxID=3064203 RepID=UPI0028A367C6|nr:hypothetical protein [Bradyrhizobium sp. WYCCWR 12699]MDT4738433.1 hypothetical protein [Bradyrhizobium sp. WYCCWR 12699]